MVKTHSRYFPQESGPEDHLVLYVFHSDLPGRAFFEADTHAFLLNLKLRQVVFIHEINHFFNLFDIHYLLASC